MEDIFKGRFELEDSRTIDSNESHPGKPGIEVKATLISNKLDEVKCYESHDRCDLAEIPSIGCYLTPLHRANRPQPDSAGRKGREMVRIHRTYISTLTKLPCL